MKFRLLHDLRAVAALLVVLFHVGMNLAKDKYFGATAAPLAEWVWFGGDAGVAFFFVLSGFIIHHIHAQDHGHPERLRDYVLKRVIRIYPSYVIIFVGVCLLALPFEELRATLPQDPWVIAKSLMLLPQDRTVVGGTGAPVIVVAWSLQFEVMFYALVGLAIFSRPLARCAMAVMAVCMVWHLGWGDDRFPLRFVGSHHLLQFAMGMWAAHAVRNGAPWRHPGWKALGAAAGFAATAVVSTWHMDRYVREWADMAYGSASALGIVAAIWYERATPAERLRTLPPVLGDASYVLYLVHFPLVAAMSKVCAAVLPGTTLWAVLAAMGITVVCVVVSVAFHVWVEAPLTAWLQLRLHARRRLSQA